MKLLICLNNVPYNLENGFNLRVFNIIKELSFSNEVYVLIKNTIKKEIEWFKQEIKKIQICCESIDILNHKAYPDKFKSLIDKRILRFSEYDPVFHKLIKITVKDVSPDGVISFHIHNIPYLIGLGKVTTLCDLIDDPIKTALSVPITFSNIRNIIKNLIWIYGIYFRMIKNVDRLTAITEEDKSKIQKKLMNQTVDVVYNGVDTNYYSPRKEGKTPVIIFTGNLHFPPNTMAVNYFAKEVWPHVIDRIPNVEFWIVGRKPVSSIKKLSGSRNIKLFNFVPDIRDFIGPAWVSVAPMVSGTGLKNKILEAWAMGKPVVATIHALQGLNAKNNENILVSKESKMFANHLYKLIHDSDFRKTIGDNARNHVVKNYSWEKEASKIIKILELKDSYHYNVF